MGGLIFPDLRVVNSSRKSRYMISHKNKEERVVDMDWRGEVDTCYRKKQEKGGENVDKGDARNKNQSSRSETYMEKARSILTCPVGGKGAKKLQITVLLVGSGANIGVERGVELDTGPCRMKKANERSRLKK